MTTSPGDSDVQQSLGTSVLVFPKRIWSWETHLRNCLTVTGIHPPPLGWGLESVNTAWKNLHDLAGLASTIYRHSSSRYWQCSLKWLSRYGVYITTTWPAPRFGLIKSHKVSSQPTQWLWWTPQFWNPLLMGWASLIAQLVKNLPGMQETWVRFMGWEDPLEKEMAIHFSILAWKIPWTEEPGGLQSMGSQESDTT